eukprot:4336724-Prymnesium_polylepis.1
MRSTSRTGSDQFACLAPTWTRSGAVHHARSGVRPRCAAPTRSRLSLTGGVWCSQPGPGLVRRSLDSQSPESHTSWLLLESWSVKRSDQLHSAARVTVSVACDGRRAADGHLANG